MGNDMNLGLSIGITGNQHFGPLIKATSLKTTGYATDAIVAMLFDNGSGATVTDYTGNGDGVVGGSDMWALDGIVIDEVGEHVSIDMPTFGDDFTIFMVVKSTTSSGAGPVSGFGKFFASGTTDSLLYLQRTNSDTVLRLSIDTPYNNERTVDDVWDTVEHTVAVTVDDSGNTTTIFVDGVATTTETASFTIPTLDSILVIGNHGETNGHARPLMAKISAFYVFDAKYELADIQSLDANYLQLFNNPPAR